MTILDAIPRRAIAVALVVLGAVYVAWLGFGVQTTGDYPNFYAPSMNALLGGHLDAFFAQLPADGAGGWLLVSAPAALAGKLLVGGQLAIFRFAALLCVLAVGGLGFLLARRMRLAGRSSLARAATIGLCVLAPMLLDTIRYGHPEEPLGAALCVVAVLLAGDGRGMLASAALGVALINKPWAVFAIPAVLLAAPSGRLAILAGAAAVAAAWTGASLLANPANFARELKAASFPLVAHPPDLWWPVAHLRAPSGVTPAYFPPRLVSDHARELAVLLAIPLSVPLLRRRTRTTDQCLALLALLLLMRCLLDPSNHIYYEVPFVIALVAWEATSRGAPLIALLSTLGLWLTFHTVAGIGSLDDQFLAFLLVTLPVIAVLVRPAFGITPKRAGWTAHGLSSGMEASPPGYLPAS